MRYLYSIFVFLAFTSLAFAGPASIKKQPQAKDQVQTKDDIEILRQQIRNGKTELISNALNISDATQAASFWTLYREYEAELKKIGDRKVALIQDYIKNYKSMNNETAESLMSRALDNQQDIVALRKKYAGKISKETSPIIAARFLQVESVVQKLVDLQVDSSLPLITEGATEVTSSTQG